MSNTNELEALAAIDDRIVGADQEDLEALEALAEDRAALLELPPPTPVPEAPPEPEPQIPARPDLTDDQLELIRKRFTVKELRSLVAEFRIQTKARREVPLIEALHGGGVDLVAMANARKVQ